MNFDHDEITEQIAQRAREYALESLAPHAEEFERNQDIPPEVFAELGALGLMSVCNSAELGGSGASTSAYARAMMEIGRGCASTAVTMAVTNMVGEVIAAFGSEDQKARHCPRLAKGGLGAFALSEVGAGSDPGGMRTTAVLEGDEWVINGDKQWISHGDKASSVIIWARTDEGSHGLSCFLVEPDTAGFTVGKHEDKMGLRASHTVGLVFDDLRVPSDALLGKRGGGFRIAMMALDGGRIGVASQALGIAESAFDEARAFVKGMEKPDQGVLWRIADMRTRLDASKLLILNAANLKQRAQPFSQEASIAKAFATEGAWKVCNEAVDVMGDAGLTRGNRAERALRDSRVTMIYEGTSEIQRVVISRGALSA
ncbi:MAG: alkylation response protein AidB-like acyl-CoA dehydrogenase [Polyangiales bacterium]|jgi:alkylation response protein AidB-like acyl-CoA dehydrogenase